MLARHEQVDVAEAAEARLPVGDTGQRRTLQRQHLDVHPAEPLDLLGQQTVEHEVAGHEGLVGGERVDALARRHRPPAVVDGPGEGAEQAARAGQGQHLVPRWVGQGPGGRPELAGEVERREDAHPVTRVAGARRGHGSPGAPGPGPSSGGALGQVRGGQRVEGGADVGRDLRGVARIGMGRVGHDLFEGRRVVEQLPDGCRRAAQQDGCLGVVGQHEPALGHRSAGAALVAPRDHAELASGHPAVLESSTAPTGALLSPSVAGPWPLLPLALAPFEPLLPLCPSWSP